MYIGLSFYYLIEVRSAGLNYLLFVLFIIWSTDTGAYFFGRALGKRKLWPEISPNKTIEGAIGGIVMGCIVGGIFQIIYTFVQTMIAVLIATFLLSVVVHIVDLLAY